MKSQIILTVEHGEDTDRLQSMIDHIREEYSERLAQVYPGRPIVLDYEVKVDIPSEDSEWRVNIQSFGEEYEYIVTADSADSAAEKGQVEAENDGWVPGTGVTSTTRLS